MFLVRLSVPRSYIQPSRGQEKLRRYMHGLVMYTSEPGKKWGYMRWTKWKCIEHTPRLDEFENIMQICFMYLYIYVYIYVYETTYRTKGGDASSILRKRWKIEKAKRIISKRRYMHRQTGEMQRASSATEWIPEQAQERYVHICMYVYVCIYVYMYDIVR